MALRVATDVGGTFTDLVCFRPQGDGVEVVTGKVDTVAGSLERGVFDVLAKADIDPAHIGFFAHGTTAVINAITERRGVRTAMVNTVGFRDTLEIARGDRPDFFNLDYRKPAPLVPRHLRYEVPGRVSYMGQELEPLDLEAVDRVARAILEERPPVEAVAVCLLHAYANTSHEDVVAARLRALCPSVDVVASTEVSRQWREYERGSTAALSAYVAPIVRRTLGALGAGLSARRMACSPYVMQSSCGVDTVAGAQARPITLIESGPSSGVLAAAALGECLGLGSLLTLDVGGTTAKCSLLPGGRVQIKTEHHAGQTPSSPGYPLLVPVVDIEEVGAGGGSVASAETVGGSTVGPKLRLGPESAGARPGPAAYGRGGARATTTDANLALGRINPEVFCGGAAKADMQAVGAALEDLRGTLELATSAVVARGIVRMANASMANALKLVSVNRGFDPRDFTLVAFGGGGGLHACELARELGIGKVIVPRTAAVFSAWGMLVSDLRRDYVQTLLFDLGVGTGEQTAAAAAGAYTEGMRRLEELAARELSGGPAGALAFEHHAALRYHDQEHTVEVLSHSRLSAELVPNLLARFRAEHERKFSYRLDAPVELVALRLVAKRAVGKMAPARLAAPRGRLTCDALAGKRLVDFGEAGILQTAIFDASLLAPAMQLDGPAVVESPSDATVVFPGMRAEVDEYGNLHIKVTATAEPRAALAADTAITQEVIQSGLQAAATEMFVAMQRTAMSAIIYEVLDFGTAILDAGAELASSGAGIPGFIVMLHAGVQRLTAKFSAAGGIAPGDLFVLNDPYRGGATHLNDILVAMPIFAGGALDGGSGDGILLGWAANMAHYSDIGGLTPGSMSTEATELFQEGLNLPGVKLMQRGVKNDAVFDIMLANSRMPERLEGDLWAAVASVRTGDRRIRALAANFSISAYLSAVAAHMDYAEAVVLQRLQQLPHRKFRLEEEQDSGVFYRATVELQRSKLLVDLSESDDQSAGPFNLSRDAAVVCGLMFLKNLTSPQSVCNGGTFRALEVRTRRGSVFDPRPPAAQGFYYEVLVRLYDMLWRTVSTGCPRLLPAGHFASICGTMFGGTHPDTGRQVMVIEPQLGGWGGSCGADGNSAVFSCLHGNTFCLPAEVAEARHGVTVQRCALNDDPGGHGEHRGGRGVCLEYRVRADDAWLTFCFTRSKFPPWGLEGGHDGTPNYVTVLRRDGTRERLSQATAMRLRAGDVFQIRTGNGAGWGAPARRPRARVLEDVRNGYVTAEDARDIYGQVL